MAFSVLEKFKGHPVLLLIAATAATTGLYLSYNKLYRPWMKRRKLAEAEMYANKLYTTRSTVR